MMFKVKKIDQSGIVSIIVTMILMIVMSLVAIGLLQLAGNEQNNALNSQLSQEAYYAADSGINYAIAKINAGPYTPNTCTSSLLSSPAYNVANTCILVNDTPSKLVYSINTGDSKVIPINPTGSSYSRFNLSWYEDGTSSLNFTGCDGSFKLYSFGSYPPNCNASVLQVDVVEVNSGTFLNNETSVYYLYPNKGTGTDITLGVTSPGLVGAACNTNSCGVNFYTSNNYNYYIKVMPIYLSNKTNLSVTAYNGTSVVSLKNAQAIITSTGKAQNVVQSLSSRVDISGTNPFAPGFAIQSQNSICADLNSSQNEPTNTSCNGVE